MLVVRGRRIVLPDGERPASIHIDGGRIAAVGGVDDAPEGAEIVDAGDLVVSPGIVDTHVHVNEPGRTEWEGFESATRAAAAGGVTTIVDMPLNSVPATTTAAALEEKRRAAARPVSRGCRILGRRGAGTRGVDRAARRRRRARIQMLSRAVRR